MLNNELLYTLRLRFNLICSKAYIKKKWIKLNEQIVNTEINLNYFYDY